LHWQLQLERVLIRLLTWPVTSQDWSHAQLISSRRSWVPSSIMFNQHGDLCL
jgi:hypothetical protein